MSVDDVMAGILSMPVCGILKSSFVINAAVSTIPNTRNVTTIPNTLSFISQPKI